ncbi:MAG: hypothetical protein ABI560_02360 [Myxococcales bacterium]
MTSRSSSSFRLAVLRCPPRRVADVVTAPLAVSVALAVAATLTPAPFGGAAGAAVEKRHVDARTGMLEVPIEELMAAIRRKDRAEIGRIAERVGPARLAQSLRRPDAPAVLAALAGIATIPGRTRLLGPVTELVVTGDAPLAAAAARTLGEILAPVTPAELSEWEVPPDVVDAACVVLRGAATMAMNSTPVRLAALDALGDASTICAPTPELVGLLRDPTPAIRRAAALVLRPQQRLATGGFASGTRDVDKGVASASVAALCEVWALPGGTLSKSGAREPIWEQTREAARRLVVAADTAADDAVQMLDCLDPTLASDRRLLDGLRARHKTPLADRAVEILNQAQSRTRP